VRVTRSSLCVAAMLTGVAADATAQTPAGDPPSRQLFGRLFAANQECAGCEGRPGDAHFVMDSPRLTAEWLARHTYQANGGSYGDNAAVADFWYDAVHRRIFTRSLVLHEVDDPADLRLGRAPGVYPNAPDFDQVLPAGTAVGHIGFVRWSSNGFGSYFAAMQGAVDGNSTGYLDLSTATGVAGTTRTGAKVTEEELVKHVRLHPSGQLDVGYDTPLATRPDPIMLVRGSVVIEGALTVAGSPVREPPAPPPLTCSVRMTTGRGRLVAAACQSDEIATGGGGTCDGGELRGSRPLVPGAAPSGWEVSCSRDGSHTVHVVCCAR
jgi:hypothetical protein